MTTPKDIERSRNLNILVSGGAGFIGSHLADKLLARGDSVAIVDNFSTGSKRNVPIKGQVRFFEYTITDGKWLSLLVSNLKPDVVVHAAASYRDPNDWDNDIETNVRGTSNVVKACQGNNVKRLIYFNTALCYGLHPTVPTPVDHPLLAEGASYAITKTAGEKLIAISGLDYVVFRLATTIGARNISGPVPTFYQRLMAKKPVYVADTRREFIYIDDLASLVLMAIDGKGKGVYNAARGKDYSIEAVLKAICQTMKIEIPRHETKPMGADDTYTILLDPSKTEKDFGWKATTSLESAIESAVFWYNEYGVGETYTHLKLGK